jgi:hypothetical protein
MSNPHSAAGRPGWIPACIIAALIPWSQVNAGRNIEERRPADPQGRVELVAVSGKMEVSGWDRSEVEVSGSAGDSVERVDVSTSGNQTSIRVVPRPLHPWGAGSDAQLVIHVPAGSAVTASLVSADLKVTGVSGGVNLQTVSGTVSGDVGGDVIVNSISGDVRLAARGARSIGIRAISGNIRLTGGGGEVDISSVSGGATVELAGVTRGRFKSVSGGLSADLALAPDGQIESEAVSGDINLNFAADPDAQFDVQTFSGDIKNCFGPKPVEQRYGPGSRLTFKNGEGHGRVQARTKSGDVSVCVRGMKSGRAAPPQPVRLARLARNLPYVF